jgi:hypothetical protein
VRIGVVPRASAIRGHGASGIEERIDKSERSDTRLLAKALSCRW